MRNRVTFLEVMEKLSKVEADVWPSSFEVLDEEGIFRLLLYHPLGKRRFKTPLLIVYAFINRPYILDLYPEVSVVRRYLEAGFGVYMIDWGYPTRVDKYLRIDDYVDYIEKCIESIKEREKVDRISLHGYCLGGTLAVVYTALHQENVKNLVLQATPINFHTDNNLAVWARNLNVDKIVDTYRMAPGDFLNMGFLAVDPINLVIGKYHGLLETLQEEEHEGILEMLQKQETVINFLRLDKWIFDSPAIPGETYRQYIKEWYQQNLLLKNLFRAQGKKVDLSKIEVPLLVLAAMCDHIAPPDSQKAILEVISSKDKDIYKIKKGHIGITVSRESHREFWPGVIEWLKQRS
jgi:polyhydroxyalkanoate synthase